MKKIVIQTPEEMFALGQKLAGEYKILFLEWELGAGKTTLVKWFAAGLGIDPQRVNSPTYTYIQEYTSRDTKPKAASWKLQGNEQTKLLHIDMYNIHSFDQLVEKWITELVYEYDCIAIEWPKFIDELWLDGVSVRIDKADSLSRRISIKDWMPE